MPYFFDVAGTGSNTPRLKSKEAMEGIDETYSGLMKVLLHRITFSSRAILLVVRQALQIGE